MNAARNALQSVMQIIESTYDHDPDTGERTDGDSPVSGADVVESLCAIEDEIAAALEELTCGCHPCACPECDERQGDGYGGDDDYESQSGCCYACTEAGCTAQKARCAE